MDALQVFHPERMADRILGMGDIVSLVERAQEQYDEEEARRLKKEAGQGPVRLQRLPRRRSAQIKKMGNLKDLAAHDTRRRQGASETSRSTDDVFKQTEAIIHSMTPAGARAIPRSINPSRKQRIAAKGAERRLPEVNQPAQTVRPDAQGDEVRRHDEAGYGQGRRK